VLTCEDCGCLVDPEATEIHQDWHDKLAMKSDLPLNSLANPRRTQVNEITVQDC
jgi:hypothetical protein